jgi:hypothetical protein
MLCLHCKNKTSNERCGNKRLPNLIFCGKHAKVKDKRVWTKVMNADRVIVLMQAIFRGWLIRSSLSLAGPGVLNSKLRHNEEDLVTCDQADPFDYFSFEKDGVNLIFFICFDSFCWIVYCNLSFFHLKTNGKYSSSYKKLYILYGFI